MEPPFTEHDWKTLREVHDELLWKLCDRINQECSKILDSKDGTPHERYLRLYKHIHYSDSIIGDCFNDLKRDTRDKDETHEEAGLVDRESFRKIQPGCSRFLKRSADTAALLEGSKGVEVMTTSENASDADVAMKNCAVQDGPGYC